MRPARRRGWTLALFTVFVVVPILEVWLLVLVGRQIGVLPTVGLLLLSAAVGTWLSKREGVRAWRRLQEAIGRGGVPTHELTDGALVLAGGLLLTLPGFATDLLGLACLVPATRALPRRALLAALDARTGQLSMRMPSGGAGDVIKGETVEPARQPEPPDPDAPAIEGRIIT